MAAVSNLSVVPTSGTASRSAGDHIDLGPCRPPPWHAFAFSRVIDLARVVSSASPEPMRFRPSHGNDAILTPLRIPLR
jgi:hypothetical protein